ncbi:hypothetical protein DRO58_04090 [Candidatus Bathyarchaeota archaeon]|nr:MAG: hypothetical protein DRO58_04090 [Candidatus Bathyarchaeota archaeon]
MGEAILESHGISSEKKKGGKIRGKNVSKMRDRKQFNCEILFNMRVYLDKKTEKKLKEWERIRSEILNSPSS